MGEYRRIDPRTIPDPLEDPLLSQTTQRLPRMTGSPTNARRRSETTRPFLMPELPWLERLRNRLR